MQVNSGDRVHHKHILLSRVSDDLKYAFLLQAKSTQFALQMGSHYSVHF